MLSGVDAPIRLLIVNDDAEEAEAIVSHLRNAGLAIRPARAATLEELDSHVATHPFDVVLAASPIETARILESSLPEKQRRRRIDVFDHLIAGAIAIAPRARAGT